MQETIFTLPLGPDWREPVKTSPYWKKTLGISINTDPPRLVDPILKVLAHPKSEEALVRLIKKSKGKLPVETFCKVISACFMYLFSKGYAKIHPPTRTVNWDKKEFQRMANNARELHNKIEKLLNAMDPLRTKGKPISKGVIEAWANGSYLDPEYGGKQLDDEKILNALDSVSKFMAKLGEPKPKHRPRDIFLDHLIFELEHLFRTNCNGRPLYPVISDLVQATTDVVKTKNKGGDQETSDWTTSRIITRLKRFYRSKENEEFIKHSMESWGRTPQN